MVPYCSSRKKTNPLARTYENTHTRGNYTHLIDMPARK